MYRILNAWIAVLFCALFAFSAPVRANEGTDVIGTVARIQTSIVVKQNTLPQILNAGSNIQLGDIISTNKKAQVEIVMSDRANLTFVERTHFVVQEYVIHKGGNDSVMRLLEGAFKVTSAKLMQTADASFIINTHTETIGICGTTFWGGSMDGDFEVALLAGKRVYLETKAGWGDLTTIGDDTKFRGASLAPSKLKKLDRKKLIGR